MMHKRLSNSSQLASYRRKFNRQLEPVKVMLVNRKHDLEYDRWLMLVHKTRSSIVNHPDQYIIMDELPVSVAQSLVARIFDESVQQVGGH